MRPHVEVPIEVEGAVRVHPDHLAREVVPAARAALSEYLSFERLEFGQPVHLSDVYRVLHRAEGVASVDVDVLRFKPFGTDEQYERFVRERGGTFDREDGVEKPDVLQAHLLVRAVELAAVRPEDIRVREG